MAEETPMSETVNGSVKAGAVSKLEASAPKRETKDLLKRASGGDESCRSEIQALLAESEAGAFHRENNGSPVAWLRRTLIEKAAKKNILIGEATTHKLAKMQAELEGPDPTPIERLLAERASLCWFIVHWYETACANSSGWTIAQADLQHRKIDKAHSRFLSALRTLAQVRKLALPTLQVNIARNQVNVAEAGP
jgi:hypothetical protein